MLGQGSLISARKEASCSCARGAWPLGGPRLSLAVTLSVNHAPVEDPGHHAALLVVQLQRDSLEDRKICDCSPEGRAPALPATSAPLGTGIACRSRAGGGIQHPLLVAERSPASPTASPPARLCLPLHPARCHRALGSWQRSPWAPLSPSRTAPGVSSAPRGRCCGRDCPESPSRWCKCPQSWRSGPG